MLGVELFKELGIQKSQRELSFTDNYLKCKQLNRAEPLKKLLSILHDEY